MPCFERGEVFNLPSYMLHLFGLFDVSNAVYGILFNRGIFLYGSNSTFYYRLVELCASLLGDTFVYLIELCLKSFAPESVH